MPQELIFDLRLHQVSLILGLSYRPKISPKRKSHYNITL